jgi:RNA:NAD 2'-phosphotransferase (TPT1/KptA family)
MTQGLLGLKVAMLKAGYDPSEARDKGGKWVDAYHGTTADTIPRIKQQGIVVGPKDQYTYLTTSLQAAERYAQLKAGNSKTAMVVHVQVPVQHIKQLKHMSSMQGPVLASRATIPPAWIKGYNTVGTIKKAGFDPNEARDEGGKWSGGGSGPEGKWSGLRVGQIKAYHGTSSVVIKDILQNGLQIKYTGSSFGAVGTNKNIFFYEDRGRAIFVAASKREALQYAAAAAGLMEFHKVKEKGTPVLLEISIPKKEWVKFQTDGIHANSAGSSAAGYTTRSIPPSWIRSAKAYPKLKLDTFNEVTGRLSRGKELIGKVATTDQTLYFVIFASPSGTSVTKLEDRLLLTKIAMLKAGFDPSQARDKGGKWSKFGRGAAKWGARIAIGANAAIVAGAAGLAAYSAYREYTNPWVEGYHGTSSKAVARIMRDGIRPVSQGRSTPTAQENATYHDRIDAKGLSNLADKMLTASIGKVFITRNESEAVLYAERAAAMRGANPILLKIRMPKSELKGRISTDAYSAGKQLLGDKGIPPEWIVGIASGRGKYRPLQKSADNGDPCTFYAVVIPDEQVDQASVTKNLLGLKVAMLKAGFDPQEARDKGGEWAQGGASGGPQPPATHPSLGQRRIRAAVNLAYAKLKSNSKDMLASVAASVLAQYSSAGGVSDMETEAVKQALLHLSERLKIPVTEARDHVVGTLKKLRNLHISKAVEDPVVKQIDRAIAELQKLDLSKVKSKDKANG